ncbi:response regulator transcription factor [Clostridium sardiniense]|uniref:Stage 0 sporulation protein A homolog n=1 Tax=Clostridium sardiniense TaxID=29369 RepID=A0ABS7KWR0_CLOSR|nr:response regulator transcription factor [Clostridium sardiniense]MBY0755245.1 response regulator transcription factor [Clostridium sardiniense]MDQ0459688.1 two-component system response regulator VanR [Clostridium sardiniense]
MKKILVVEDDIKINELIIEFLKSEGYKVYSSFDGLSGYSKFKEDNYDLVILDIMMPKLDGYGLCNLIREESDVPIIFLTALSEAEDEIKGFDAMADDYITKPFSFNVLIKRVEAVLRRSEKTNDLKDELSFGNLYINLNTYKVYIDNKEVEFTLKEFNILNILMKSYPNVVSREMLMDKVWGYDYYGDMRVIDAHIKNIRKKIEYDYIGTVKGVGYVLKE